jgi:hypothetical protein
MPSPAISFCDTVMVQNTDETRRLRVAGLCGIVYGFTTPSHMGTTVIGSLTRDYAINVHFKDLNEQFWFAEQLLVFQDHGAGTEIGINGKCFVRTEAGEWVERPPNAQ